jgi:hypothetical protein
MPKPQIFCLYLKLKRQDYSKVVAKMDCHDNIGDNIEQIRRNLTGAKYCQELRNQWS